jgi:hypothetical protein
MSAAPNRTNVATVALIAWRAGSPTCLCSNERGTDRERPVTLKVTHATRAQERSSDRWVGTPQQSAASVATKAVRRSLGGQPQQSTALVATEVFNDRWKGSRNKARRRSRLKRSTLAWRAATTQQSVRKVATKAFKRALACLLQ